VADPESLDGDLPSLAALNDPVRRAVYRYVAGSGRAVGRDDAAAAAGINRSLAAYHLDRLVGEGLLTAEYRRPPGRGGPGAGRPAKLYRRSPAELQVTVPPRDYELAATLLAVAVDADESGEARTALAGAARTLGADLGAEARDRHRASDGGPARIETVLAERGYEPFEDEPGILRLRNCPFHRLAARHRDLVCGMNLALLEALIAAVESGAEVVLEPADDRCCVAVRYPTPSRSATSATRSSG
jgi:predicted ArsR family transcriptional regulator